MKVIGKPKAEMLLLDIPGKHAVVVRRSANSVDQYLSGLSAFNYFGSRNN